MSGYPGCSFRHCRQDEVKADSRKVVLFKVFRLGACTRPLYSTTTGQTSQQRNSTTTIRSTSTLHLADMSPLGNFLAFHRVSVDRDLISRNLSKLDAIWKLCLGLGNTTSLRGNYSDGREPNARLLLGGGRRWLGIGYQEIQISLLFSTHKREVYLS